LVYKITYCLNLILLDLNSIDLQVYILIDWRRSLFSGVVCFISAIVVIYRSSYIIGDSGYIKFLYIVLLFVASIIFMIIGTNIVMILLGWDGLGLVSYCLVIYYQNESSNRAGIITVLANRVGDVGILIGLIFIVNFRDWGMYSYYIRDQAIYIVGTCLIVGAITKRAQVPFSAWLPAAIAAPTPVSALVHSSTLVTAGVYLIIRINMFFSNGIISLGLLAFSVCTMLISGLSAVFEIDLKKIIALSTLSQLGVIIIILSVGYLNLAYFHLFTHALFKAILFLCAGVIIHGSGGVQDIRRIGLIWTIRPFIGVRISLANIALSGFPFLRGFYSKDLLLEVMYIININIILTVMLVVSTILTVVYSLRLIYYCLWRAGRESSFSNYIDLYIIVIPIYMIVIFVIFRGSLIRWIIFPEPVFIHLTTKIKGLNVILVILSVWIYFIQFNLVWIREAIGKFTHFFGGLWFLPILTGGGTTYFIKNIKNYHLEFDQAWLEQMSSLGIQKRSLYLNTVSVRPTGLGPIIKLLFLFFIVLLII